MLKTALYICGPLLAGHAVDEILEAFIRRNETPDMVVISDTKLTNDDELIKCEGYDVYYGNSSSGLTSVCALVYREDELLEMYESLISKEDEAMIDEERISTNEQLNNLYRFLKWLRSKQTNFRSRKPVKSVEYSCVLLPVVLKDICLLVGITSSDEGSIRTMRHMTSHYGTICGSGRSLVICIQWNFNFGMLTGDAVLGKLCNFSDTLQVRQKFNEEDQSPNNLKLGKSLYSRDASGSETFLKIFDWRDKKLVPYELKA